MENNEYFTEKIAPKKNNPAQSSQSANQRQSKGERPEKRRREPPRKPKSEPKSIDLTLTADDNSPKVEIIGVRFKDVGKVYFFAPKGVQFKRGESVIVETARGVECGEVVLPNRDFPQSGLVSPLKDIIRKATDADFRQLEQNKKKEAEIMKTFTDKIREHNLDMKPIEIEVTFDGSKIMFYFTSDGRVDFRELVKDLAFIYRTRIELRQIGVRDEAKMLGGLGICGRPFCCSSFLGDFQPVSIKMAKEQSLSLNPTKISGTCGRLMCCLKYEQNCYEDFLRTTPKVGAYVETPEGRGSVQEVNLLTGILKVKLDKKPDVPLVVNKDEVKIIKDGKIKIDREELKALKNLEEN